MESMTVAGTFGLFCCLAASPLVAQPELKHAPELLQPGPMRIDVVKDGLYLIRGPFLPYTPNGCWLTAPTTGSITSRATSRCASRAKA